MIEEDLGKGHNTTTLMDYDTNVSVDQFIKNVNGAGTLNDEQRANFNRSWATIKANQPVSDQVADEAKVRAVLKA